MTRVVVLANNITELGGAQRVAHVLAQGLAERGHQVQLVGIHPKEPAHRYHEAPAAHESVTLLDETMPPAAQHQARAELSARAAMLLGELLAAGEPGIVITTQVWCMEHLAQAPHAGWRVIGQYHSSYEAAAGGRDLARLRDAYARVDWFTLLTDADAARFRAHGMPHAIAMPNPLAFWPAEPARGDARVVTYLGRLSAEKAPAVLLDAWSRIADRHPDWRLQFVGGGPLEDELRALAVPRAEFLPAVDQSRDVLLASGVLALPSLVEGFPLALAEAMACGLPVAASDCSAGVRELVTDEVTGLLSVRGDAASLAARLDELLGDEDLRRRLGAAARERMAAYRVEPIVDRWERLLSATLR